MDFDNRKVYGDTSIADGLVQFCYATALFGPVKVHQKVCQSGQNGPKLRVPYALKYTGLKKSTLPYFARELYAGNSELLSRLPKISCKFDKKDLKHAAEKSGHANVLSPAEARP